VFLCVSSCLCEHLLNLVHLKDGITVRSLFALATPLVPLLLLIACGCLEVFSRGLGGFVAVD
jgi:hypothetical protein